MGILSFSDDWQLMTGDCRSCRVYAADSSRVIAGFSLIAATQHFSKRWQK
jgi:hypothetical protein